MAILGTAGAGGAGGAVLLLCGGVAFAIWRSRRREEPRKVARGEASPWQKILTAVGTTIAVSLTKKLIDRAWSRPHM